MLRSYFSRRDDMKPGKIFFVSGSSVFGKITYKINKGLLKIGQRTYNVVDRFGLWRF